MLSILRRAPFGERGRAVLGPQIGVDQHAALALQSLADIEHRLRLQPVVAAVEIAAARLGRQAERSEEHTSELQSLMRISYAVFCLTRKSIARRSMRYTGSRRTSHHHIHIVSTQNHARSTLTSNLQP